jgi:phage shock protein A
MEDKMFRTVTTLFRAGVAEADEDLQDRTASTLLAQHLRDAKTELARHRAGLAALMARETKEARLGEALAEKLARRETEVETALAASDEELAADIAEDMLRVEDEIRAATKERDRLKAEVAKARAAQDAAERTFKQLSDQLRIARTRAVSPLTVQTTSLKQAEAAAERLKCRMERDEDIAAAYEQMETTVAEQDLDTKLKASGLFDDKAAHRDAILERIKSKGETK